MSVWEPTSSEPLMPAHDPLRLRDEGCGEGCTEALDRLFEYLDSELEAPDQQRVRAHLEECRPCLEEFDVEVVVKRLVRRCCQEEAPTELRVRIEEQMTFLRMRRP
ncbi:mycothiol system anti-sigma-R factor [Cellulomonas timonensis]|uniref:mycothiol system anti-sigma-R factor n=1 Tax=Cellulomonas timonensis TaxID=1689271 RepID=UPI0009EDED1D|nr:mycothiol system anti-sigma-R factor [Cellulomonas timonensis]